MGQAIERTVESEAGHSYRLALAAGQYVRVEIFQYWQNVITRLFDPAGKLVCEVKLRSDNGQTERLSAVAEQTGDYRLEIKTVTSGSLRRGHYVVTWTQQRAVTAQDHTLVEADRLQLTAYALAQKEPKSEEAIKLSEKGLALYEQVYGTTHQELLETLKLLAGLQERRANHPAAEALYRRALAIGETTLGRDHLVVAELWSRLGDLDQFRARYATAKPARAEALRIREKLLKPDDLRLAEAIFEWGITLRYLNDFAQADVSLRRSLSIWEEKLGTQDPSTLRVVQELAALYASKGDYGKAEPLFERLVATLEQRAVESRQLASALLNLGRVNVDLGNVSRAEPHIRRALAMFEKLTGKESADTASALALLGRVSAQQKNHAEAEAAYRRALAIREKLFGPDNNLTG
ncbi:MAG: tetratricopeptide repeat protein, partial [Acidobacteria bacterium]|nr:tetratricopeptide repeat protein [Acidobacteriota bacterium]